MKLAILLFAAAACAAKPFQWTELHGGKLALTENDRPVLVFNYGLQLKDGVKEQYRRACYFHPVYDLDGVTITDDFPKDHPHHRGLFWAWPEVTVGEQKYDPWACVGMQQRFKRWLSRDCHASRAVLAVENGWFAGDRSVVRETLRAIIYRAEQNHRVVDVELTLEAENEPVILRGRADGKKGYGGFTFRFAPRRDASITLPSGRIEKDAVQVNAPWADYSAKFGADDRISGVAIFDHPTNPNHPTPWLLRHYGVLNPTWPGLVPVALRQGQRVKLQYRLVIHRGDPTTARVAELFASWTPGR